MEKRRNCSWGAISPLFHNIFNISLTSGVKLHIHLLNVVVRFIVFLTSATLIFRGTDISKCFRKSLGIRDNESRLYLQNQNTGSTSGHLSLGIDWENGPERVKTVSFNPIRKYAHWNILKILPPKNEIFSNKNSDILHISLQNIDCGYSLEPPRRGGSNEYPQSMFLSRNK